VGRPSHLSRRATGRRDGEKLLRVAQEAVRIGQDGIIEYGRDGAKKTNPPPPVRPQSDDRPLCALGGLLALRDGGTTGLPARARAGRERGVMRLGVPRRPEHSRRSHRAVIEAHGVKTFPEKPGAVLGPRQDPHDPVLADGGSKRTGHWRYASSTVGSIAFAPYVSPAAGVA